MALYQTRKYAREQVNFGFYFRNNPPNENTFKF